LEALKSELKGSIEKGVSFASNGATVAVWSKLTQLFLQALLEATILLQVQLVVKRRSNMEQENINWLFFYLNSGISLILEPTMRHAEILFKYCPRW
jgi:hypothetical protein